MLLFTLFLVLFVLKNTGTVPVNESPIDSWSRNIISVNHTFAHLPNRHKNNLIRLRRDAHYYEDLKDLLYSVNFLTLRNFTEELIVKLRSVANETVMEVGNWTEDVEEQLRLFKYKAAVDIDRFIDGVKKAQSDLEYWSLNESESFSRCIWFHKYEAEALYGEVVEETNLCINKEFNKISALFKLLDNKSTIVMNAAERIFNEMMICTKKRSDEKGSCLAKVLMRNKNKVALIGEIGFLIGRTSFSVLKFPDDLDKCVTSLLMDAGLKIEKVMLDFSECSISSTFEMFFGDLE